MKGNHEILFEIEHGTHLKKMEVQSLRFIFVQLVIFYEDEESREWNKLVVGKTSGFLN